MSSLDAHVPQPPVRPATPDRARFLLPSALGEEENGRRTARDWIVDVVTMLVAILGGFTVLGELEDVRPDLLVFADLIAGVVAIGLLWLRRSHPLAIALITVLLATAFAMAGVAALVAYFGAVIRVSWRALAWLTLIVFASTFVAPLLYAAGDYQVEVVVGLLVGGVALGWGLFVRAQRELLRSLRERAVQAESEQRLRVEQAREAERRRIAREMHDVLAHRISLLSLHAGALEFRPDAPPQEVAEAAGVVRATAHAALEDLRDVIGVLREDGVAAGAEPEPPQPTLSDVPALVQESRAAGMRVRCAIDLGPRAGEALPDTLGRTVYRVIQEGLTNARKHAAGAAVEVEVVARGDALLASVRCRRPLGGVAADRLPGAGTGLVGLAERVSLAGGELRHGPDAHGDFLLRATLPWERAR